MRDAAVRAEQESHANNSHKGLAVHRFFAPSPISFEHLMGLVGKEPDGEVVLLLEGILCLYRIGRDAQNFSAGFLEVGAQLGEIDGFAGAAGRIGSGIEIEDQLSPLEISQ